MINGIVAVSKNQGIGLNGQMPWPHLTNDLRWFKEKTTDQVIVMGRKTWESIGSKKLPKRINVVLSKNKIEGCDLSLTVPDSCLDVIRAFYPNKDIFIIGGGEIYKFYIPVIQRFFITEIEEHYHCDTFFDLNYVKKNFTKVKEHAIFNDPIKYTIKEYSL
jgi:dihydrofolate reductase